MTDKPRLTTTTMSVSQALMKDMVRHYLETVLFKQSVDLKNVAIDENLSGVHHFKIEFEVQRTKFGEHFQTGAM